MDDVYEIARAGLELAEKATPGEWTVHPNPRYYVMLPTGEDGDSNRDNNAALTAHAGTHYAALCRALLAQKAVVEAAVAHERAHSRLMRLIGTKCSSKKFADAERDLQNERLATIAAVRAMKEPR